MKRLAWVDNLRIMVITFVVILHTAVTYSGLGSWYYKEGSELGTSSLIFFALFQTFFQAFSMSLLFMVSGYFSKISLERKGMRAFSLGRLNRLGIPLLIFIFIIQPISVKLAYPDIDIFSWYMNGIQELRFLSWTGPLWFVEALLIFTLFFALLQRFRISTRIRFSPELNPLNVVLLVLVITTFAFILRIYFPIGTDFYNLQLGFFSAYIVMFIFGIFAYSSGILEKISLRDGKRWLLISLGIGIPAWFLIMFFGGPMDGIMLIEGGFNCPAFFYALWESFFCVTFILALVGIFRHKLNIGGRFQKFLSDNAFGVFVFHTPVLILISVLFKGFEAQPIIKFAVVAALAVPASFITAWIVRQIKTLRKIFT